jgi:hypothetical protein
MHPQGLWRGPEPACCYYHVAWDLPESPPNWPPTRPRGCAARHGPPVSGARLVSAPGSAPRVLLEGPAPSQCGGLRLPLRPGTSSGPPSRRVLRGSEAAFRGGRGQRAPRMSGLGLSGASGFEISSTLTQACSILVRLKSWAQSAATGASGSQKMVTRRDRRDLTALRRSSFAVCVRQ